MTKPDRLYGLKGAEYLQLDMDTVIEQLIDDGYAGEVTIEEWTVCDTRSLFPKADWVIDYILDHLDAVTEEWHEAALNAADPDGEVTAAFDAALNVWSSKVKFWQADQLVGTHQITVDPS